MKFLNQFLYFFYCLAMGSTDFLAQFSEDRFTKHMAKLKFGSWVTGASGSIGFHTLSRNRSGAYIKNKPQPINRNTASQVGVRNFFGFLTQNWQALTATQRESWNGQVNNNARINSITDRVILSGHQLYIAVNRVLQTIGSALLTTAPVPVTVGTVTTGSVAAAAGAGTMSLTYTPAIPASDTWILEATRPLSAGIQSNSQDFKKINHYVTADASPINIKAAYEAIFGTTWQTAGVKIFYRLKPVNTTKGSTATAFTFSAIVAA